ncbi:21098_t:CDS:2 [Cetraspora pellucida]|uniref:21098_t:CDS:1 n=1 Tax=Cetraspora pellucida TaxID=1433469 RepID=A0A9N9GR36_9GLOM|nr:21098_t:CDS:2 [Cetraspora pellucida]
MNVLKQRHQVTDSQGREQVEFLDEHEQENLIEEFRMQNDGANNFFKIVTIIHLYCGIFLSLVSVIMAIGTEQMEQLWWGIPFGLLIIDIIALYIIKDSEQDINGLEKLKYKYKGA